MSPEELPAQEPATQEPAGRARMQQLHAYLVKEKTDVPADYKVFEEKLLEQPERLKQLHDYLVKEKTDVPADYSTFEEKLTEGLKKKDQSDSGKDAGTGSSADKTFVDAAPTAAAAVPPMDPAVQGAPQLVDDSQIGAQLAANPEQRARIIEAEAQTLGAVPEGFSREIYNQPNGPMNEAGELPRGDVGEHGVYGVPGSKTGVQYIDKPLSKLVDGKEQSQDDAQMLTMRNELVKGFQGFLNYGAGLNRKIQRIAGIPEGYTAAMDPFQRGADMTEKAIGKVSPFHEQSKAFGMQVARAAGMALPVAVSLVLPEGRAAKFAAELIGGNFEGQIMQGSFDRADAAKIPKGSAEYDNYTLADATASKIVFLLGGAGLNKLGQAALKNAVLKEVFVDIPKFYGQRIEAAAMGTMFEKAMPRALLAVKNAAKGGAHLGPLMAANTIKEKVGEHLENQHLGRAAFAEKTLGEDVADVATEGVKGFGIGAASGLFTRSPKPGETAPVEAPAGPRPFSEMSNAEHADWRASGGQDNIDTGLVKDGHPVLADLTHDGKFFMLHDGGASGERHKFFDDDVALNKQAAEALSKLGHPKPSEQLAPVEAPAEQATGPQPLPEGAGASYAAEQRWHNNIPLGFEHEGKPVFADVTPDGKFYELHDGTGSGDAINDPTVHKQAMELLPTKLAELQAQTALEAAPAEPIAPEAQPEAVAEAPAIPEQGQPLDIMGLNGLAERLAPAAASTPEPASTESGQEAPAFATPAENRAAGRFTKDGATYTRQAPLGARAIRGNEATTHFAVGVSQSVHYALVEAADLQPSHTSGTQNLNHFLPEAQPKNRSAVFDQASQKAIGDIAAKPDVTQLGEAPTAYAGAPIINSRGEVIQGNGRSEGIRQHYQQGGESYRAEVLKAAEKAGVDPTQAAGMKEPVLVRIADVSDARARELGNYSAADTESGGQRTLDPKQTAARMDEKQRADLGRLLTPVGEATLVQTIRAKQAEIIRFLQKHGLANGTQLQTLVNADGTLKPKGVEAIAAVHRQLLFADGDPNLPELFQDLPDAAQGGIDRAVGHLGGLPESASILPELQNAVSGTREFLASGVDFATWTNQTDLFAPEGQQSPAQRYSPLELKLINLLANEKRPTYIARVFAEYAAAVRGEEAGLFGSKPGLPRADAVQQTFKVNDDSPRTRNLQPAQSPARPSAADGRPAPSPAPGVESQAAVEQPSPRPADQNTRQDEVGPYTYHTYNRPNSQLPNKIDGHTPTFTGNDTFTVPEPLSESTIKNLELDPITEAEALVGKEFNNEGGYPVRFGKIEKANGRSFITVEKIHPTKGTVYQTEQMPLSDALKAVRDGDFTEKPVESGQPPVEPPTAAADAIEELPGTKDRKSTTNLLADPETSEAVKQGIRDAGIDKYEPRSPAEAEKQVDEYLRDSPLADAVKKALGTADTMNGDMRTILRAKVLQALGKSLDAAVASGDTVAAEAHNNDAMNVAHAMAERLTDAGQEINAAKILSRYAPETAVYTAEKEVAKQRAAKEAQLAKKALPKEKKKQAAEKKEALDNTLSSKAIKAAREKAVGKAPATTKEQLAEEKSTRADLFEKLKKLNANLGITPQQQAIAELHVKIFKSYIKSGLLKVRELVEQFKKDAPGLAHGVDTATLIKQANAALGDHAAATDQLVRAMNDKIDRIARDHSTDAAAVGKSLAEKFVEDAGLDPVAAKQMADAIEKEFANRIAAARQKRIDELNKRAAALSSPKRAAATDLQKTQELFTLSPTSDAAILDHLKRVNDLPTLSLADVANLRALAQKVKDAKGQHAEAEAVFNLMLAQKNIKGITPYESVKAFFYAHLLTGLFTHAKNFAFTGFNGATQLVSETGYAGYLAMGHMIRTRDVRALGLIAAPYRGIGKSFKSSLDQAYKIIATGVEPLDVNDKYGTPNDLEALRRKFPTSSNADIRALQLGVQWYATAMSYAGRFLKANDVLFQVNFANMRAFNLAIAEAMNQGKTLPTAQIWGNAMDMLYNSNVRLVDAQAQAFAEIPNAGVSKNPFNLDNNRWRMRVQEIMEESRDVEINKQSKEGAARDAFNGPLEGMLGDATSKLQSITDVEGPGGVQPLKTQIPFTKIISNQVNASLDYIPLVGGYRAIRGKIGHQGNAFERKFTGKDRAETAIRATMGAALMYATGTALLGPKRLSGSGPDDQEKKRALKAAGWMESSYNFGTEANPSWWSYKNTKFNLLLSAIANVREGEEYNGADYTNDPLAIKRLGAITFGVLQGVKSNTGFQNVADLFTAIGNVGDGTADERFMRYFQRQAGSTVGTLLTPGGNMTNQVSKIAQRALDVPKQDAQTAWEVMTQNLNWNAAAPAYDDLGYPMRIDNDVFHSTQPDWHDETEQAIRSFQAKYGKRGVVFVPDAQRMNNDMAVLRQNPTAAVLTRADFDRMTSMTDSDKKAFLQKRGDLEGPMGKKMFADFKLNRAVKIREGYALLLYPKPPIGDAKATEPLEEAMERNPHQAELLLKNLYQTATRQAKLEVLGGDYGRLGFADQESTPTSSGSED